MKNQFQIIDTKNRFFEEIGIDLVIPTSPITLGLRIESGACGLATRVCLKHIFKINILRHLYIFKLWLAVEPKLRLLIRYILTRWIIFRAVHCMSYWDGDAYCDPLWTFLLLQELRWTIKCDPRFKVPSLQRRTNKYFSHFHRNHLNYMFCLNYLFCSKCFLSLGELFVYLLFFYCTLRTKIEGS